MVNACPTSTAALRGIETPFRHPPAPSSQSYSVSPGQLLAMTGAGRILTLRAGHPAGAGAEGQGQDEESLVWDTDPINSHQAAFPWLRQREIPQLAPGLWKSPFREVSFGQLSARAHRKARAGTWAAGWAGRGKPRVALRPWGWEQNPGDSEKGREQQEVTCQSGTEHSWFPHPPPPRRPVLTAPDECFPQMKQFKTKQMPKTTPG